MCHFQGCYEKVKETVEDYSLICFIVFSIIFFVEVSVTFLVEVSVMLSSCGSKLIFFGEVGIKLFV